MKKMMSWAFLPLATFLALNGSGFSRDRYNDKESVYRAGYDQGYADGLRRGEQDYRSGGRQDNRNRDYHDDRGYNNSMGHKGDYKKGYREGYQTGYNQGLQGRGNGAGRIGSRRYPGYPNQERYPNGRYPLPERYPDQRYPAGSSAPYPGGRLPGGAYPDYPRTGNGIAFDRGMDRGYRDGLKKGEEDYRKSRNYDPNRHKDFREADEGYKSSYGDKRDYQEGYRRGFEQGYRRNFRG